MDSDDMVFPDGYVSGFSTDKPDGGEVDFSKLVWMHMQKLVEFGTQLGVNYQVYSPAYINGVQQFGFLLLPYFDKKYIADLSAIKIKLSLEEKSIMDEYRCRGESDSIFDTEESFLRELRHRHALELAEEKHQLLICLAYRKNFLPGRKVGLKAND